MGPEALSQVLRQIDFIAEDDNLLVGLDKSDDAIAYQLNDQQIIVQSVDFFTPIVDDPYLFGQIAAANALSDIYAMGAKPILAMNIVGFPSCLDDGILRDILQGGADKVAEAGAIIAGGHTIQDDEPKYGLSVTGVADKGQLLTNSNAQVGDKLILTKALGMGIMSTAIKGGLAIGGIDNPVIKSMTTLNNKALEPMQKLKVNACTDITGFGLLGHVWELAAGSKVGIEISSAELPIFEGIVDYAEMGLVPEGAYSNRQYLKDKIKFDANIKKSLIDILFDPQTSGGLLISVPADKAADLLIELYTLGVDKATVIGEVIDEEGIIRVR
ncbi:selenophosphate synthase [Orenia marismortui]|uniref:Selenide, water dikinase n=2 Tax=Orenia marismortui TaxID=46469 RepID=A0A4R8GTT8_9FIRM|nr:selenophosphate synthase [Orenia marismortui]